jgi:cell division protein FtsL
MSNRLSLLLTVLLVTCALALVNTQYQARQLFIELERAQAQSRQLDIEWAQLQLDQSTLGKNSRIEASARRELGMVPLTPNRTQYMTLTAASKAEAP